MVRAGASALCIHGRLIHQRHHQGEPDWNAIKRIKEVLDIPVIANGGGRSRVEVERCLEVTKCDAYMSAIPLLEDPRLFEDTDLNREDHTYILDNCKEYLLYCDRYW